MCWRARYTYTGKGGGKRGSEGRKRGRREDRGIQGLGTCTLYIHAENNG